MARADDEKLLKEYESVNGTAQRFCDALVEREEGVRFFFLLLTRSSLCCSILVCQENHE